jgi:hypothetical protein
LKKIPRDDRIEGTNHITKKDRVKTYRLNRRIIMFDFHMHSWVSDDCSANPRDMVAAAEAA